MAVCTENLNPNVLTMKSAQYGARIYDAGSLNLRETGASLFNDRCPIGPEKRRLCVRKSPMTYANSCRVWSMRERLLRVQSERLELPAPLGRRIAKTLHANAAGQA